MAYYNPEAHLGKVTLMKINATQKEQLLRD
jgi:hypothetical protein